MQEWRAEIEAGKLAVFLLDECHLLWGDVCGYGWGKTEQRLEIAMTSERQRQTYYGAFDYRSQEFLVQAYDSGNSEEFLKYLQAERPGQRVVVVWDGASYHRSVEVKAYLQEVNGQREEKDWPVRCLRFAPNAPEQNPVEDIWLQAKRFIRKFYQYCKSFAAVKWLFELVTHHPVFNFAKASMYGSFS